MVTCVNLAMLEGREPDIDELNRIRVFSPARDPMLSGMLPESLVEKWTKNCTLTGKAESVPAIS